MCICIYVGTVCIVTVCIYRYCVYIYVGTVCIGTVCIYRYCVYNNIGTVCIDTGVYTCTYALCVCADTCS